MSYDSQTWINGPGGGTPRSATRFNHMEAGIQEASDRAGLLELGVAAAVGVDYAPSLALNAQSGGLFRVVATGDLALNDITGGVDGQEIVLEVQAAGGDRVLTIIGQDPVTIPGDSWWVGRFRFNEDTDNWLLTTGGGGGGGAVDSVNGQTGVVVLDADDVADGSAKVVMTTAERTKLGGVATAATANASNAQLRDRGTHTGEQSIATITGLQTALNALAVGDTGGDTLYARGVNMAGAEFAHDAAHLPGVYGTDYAYPSTAEIQAMASRGHKIVRLPFRWERIQPTRGAALNSAELTRLQTVAADAAAVGMQVILDVHNYARYIDSSSNGGLERVLGTANLPVSSLVDLWTRLSTAFKTNPGVYAYDLMNEPHDLVAVPGGFTGTTRYDWSDGVQGWTGDSATASVVSGRLRLAATATNGFFQFRKDDGGTKRGGAITGNALEATVTLGAGIAGSWRALLQWQNSSFSWQSAASTTYTRVDNGATVTGLIAGVAVRVRAAHTAITAPNAFAIQIEANNATAGAVSADIDDFAQGSITGGMTEAQVWEDASQQVVDAIRGAGDDTKILVPGYNYSGAKNWVTNHSTPWISGGGDIAYQAHYYFDVDNSGDYPDTYATENAAAVTAGYASLPARAVAELGNWTGWLADHDVKGLLGEVGWPNTADTTLWNSVGEALYDLCDTHQVDVTYWAAGARWGTGYNLSIYTGEAQDTVKAQAAVVESHPTVYQDLTSQVAALDGRVTVLETSGVGGGAATQAAPYVGPAFMVIDAESLAELVTAKTNGATHALVQVKWDQHQSSLGGGVDATTVLERIDDAVTAGLKVCLRVSPQYIPTFVDTAAVKFKRAGGTEHNPGNVSGYNVRDWVWSKSTRAMVEDFLGKLFAQLDWSQIERVQVGGGPAGELQFPLSDFASNPNVPYWWAYSTPAQSGGSDLAPRMAACPVPGHVPSTGTTWTDNDEKFVGWYTQSLNNWMIWLIEQHRRYFSGPVYVMHPGFGLRRQSMTPTGSGALNYRMQVASGLDWAAQIGAYPDADCHPYSTWCDGTHPWDPAPYSEVNDGNAAAWLHLLRVARSLGRAGRIWGENTAINSGNDVMDRVFKEHAVAHGYEGVTWLNHDGLASGDSDTYANFAARIAEIKAAQIDHQPPAVAVSSGSSGDASSGALNVKDYGAVGDGTTTDTTAISTAMDAAVAAGAPLFFPPGTYLCGTVAKTYAPHITAYPGTVTILAANTSSWTWNFAGTLGSATLLTANAIRNKFSLTVASTAGLAAGDLVLVGDDQASYASQTTRMRGQIAQVASIDSGTALTLTESVYATMNTASNAFVAKVTAPDRLRISGLRFLNTNSASTGGFIRCTYVRDIDIDVAGEGSGAAGIRLEHCYDFRVRKVARNYLDNGTTQFGYGVEVVGASAHGQVNVQASRVRHAFSSGGIDNTYGEPTDIRITGVAHGCSAQSWDAHAQGSDIVFADCLSFGARGYGFALRGRRQHVLGGSVQGGYGGVWLFESAFDNRVAGLRVSDIAASDSLDSSGLGGRGIRVQSSAIGLTVTDCELVNIARDGIAIDSTGSDVNITNNVIRNAGQASGGGTSAIHAAGVLTRARIMGNTVADNQTAKTTTAAVTLDATNVDTVLRGNDVQTGITELAGAGAASAQVVANSTDAQLRDRATHTGSQLASTVSDFTEAAQDAAAAMVTGASHTGISFTYNDASNTLAASVTGGGADAATPYGRVFLDDFAGADDDAKLTAAMTAMAAETYPRTITLRARQYTFTTANRIAYTGLRIEGPPGYGNPERQSQTKMPGRVHLSMTGPWFHNNGATVFSCSFHQLSFTGGSNATVIGQSGGGSWYCLSMRDIFSSGTRTVLGTQATPLLITAASFTGDWEINNCYNGAFHIGGSDNVLWQDGCLLDSDPAFNTAGSANGQYHVWFDSLEKSEVGPLYITAEGAWNGIRVTGPAWNTVTANTGTSWWHGVRVEGRNKDQPCNGSLLRVEGGFVSIRDSWFGYAMASPTTPGHSPADAGVIHHSGGGLSVHTCTYDRATGVAETVPFVYANSSGPTRVNNIWTAARGGTWTGLPRVSDVGAGTLISDASVTVV